jgi:hypothetical protein
VFPANKTERISDWCRKLSFRSVQERFFHVHALDRCKLAAKQAIFGSKGKPRHREVSAAFE